MVEGCNFHGSISGEAWRAWQTSCLADWWTCCTITPIFRQRAEISSVYTIGAFYWDFQTCRQYTEVCDIHYGLFPCNPTLHVVSVCINFGGIQNASYYGLKSDLSHLRGQAVMVVPVSSTFLLCRGHEVGPSFYFKFWRFHSITVLLMVKFLVFQDALERWPLFPGFLFHCHHGFQTWLGWWNEETCLW